MINHLIFPFRAQGEKSFLSLVHTLSQLNHYPFSWLQIVPECFMHELRRTGNPIGRNTL